MPRILSLKKIKGKDKSVHPASRKANQIQRAALRDERISNATLARTKTQMSLVNKVGFFKVAAIASNKASLDEESIKSLIYTYINRHANEIKDLAQKRRAGRAPSPREDALRMGLDAEMSEFKSGFSAPDLRDEEVMNKLKAWHGDYGGLQQIAFCRIVMGDDAP